MKKYLIGCLFLIMNSVLSCKQETKNSIYPSNDLVIEHHNDWAIKQYPKRIKEFKNDPLQKGDIVLLGDSITEGGNDWSEKLGVANAKNRGISGDITYGVLQRLEEIIESKPEKVFVLIGVNDLFNYIANEGIPSVNYVESNIIEICIQIRKRSPKTVVYLQSLLPTATAQVNKEILKVNTTIKKNEALGLYQVIDLHASFINNKGFLKEAFTYDGLHLNDKGYEVWVNVLKSYLETSN
ncbi:GDSL-type esterase/lipase family protein [Aquimarina agarivorans]|uniref:GDSL-type esterase/lipase family protein n=1 Tax=Aquimarina agarivorans TaxID=980584 RepID=UPI000248EC20|nr:GDSL-type esterase/lipase family protein [Aquimarina agarivorans]